VVKVVISIGNDITRSMFVNVDRINLRNIIAVMISDSNEWIRSL